jgi:hypothetical protein
MLCTITFTASLKYLFFKKKDKIIILTQLSYHPKLYRMRFTCKTRLHEFHISESHSLYFSCERKMLDLQHQYNNYTIIPHMRMGLTY